MVNKKELTEKRRRKKSDEKSPDVQLSENESFLTEILNYKIEERKKVSSYLGEINQNIRILKNILNEVK